ncbi:MAG: hypothetical protein KKE30_16680 [Gammaproteobacteria bacterium]|nr:hypothetical protein [Gammaproteobacteria bacterium]MBU1555420.1 hypothetical protein [Gammaproteobacteria bacterium]MBU2070290.1 hypothetical protein [Gammaproteobacteria bacterium]MBU2185328.1 hypothetical protein [Gammaproteobacteria bacterium]MBU2203578.1 hypothetical protein [Gammaproteobacteria bacterium]
MLRHKLLADKSLPPANLKSTTEEKAVVSGTINENMKNIANAVESTTVKSTELSVTSQQLRQMAREMKKSLSGFKL